jgi:hypothetical protein
MIGERIESQQRFPFGAVFCFAVAVVFVGAAAAFRSPHPAVFAVLPAAVGAGLLLGRGRPFRAEITREGLEIEEPPLVLAYADIEAARMPGTPDQARAPIQLFYDGGCVLIPERLNVRSGELFRFLLDQLPPSGSRDLPPILARYCAQQEARYGSDRVFSYRARPQRIVTRNRTAVAVCLAGALAGLAWAAAGAALGKEGAGWIVCGIFMAVLFGVFALAFGFATAGPRIQNWRQSGLVIGPEGLALVQGDMRGELRWDELRDIRFRTKPGFLATSPQLRGIHLVVAGATITIADLYDRPLDLIHERLLAGWKPIDRFA